MHDLVASDVVDLRNFDQMSGDALAQTVRGMFKSRAKIAVAMKASGHHSDDMWTCLRETFLTPQAGAAALPGAPVCHLDLLCFS